MSHVTRWVRYPHPKSQRLQLEQQNSITKICMYYKLGQACVTNWGSFVLLQIRASVITNWSSFIITNQVKCCYKLGQLLHIRATVITKQGSYYKLGQNVLKIGAGITNQGNYYKLGHSNMVRKNWSCESLLLVVGYITSLRLVLIHFELLQI